VSETKITIASGMTIQDVYAKGSSMQKRIACVFDSDRNGVYNEKEAKLFNSTSAVFDKYGDIEFYTNFSKSGKKQIAKFSEDELNTKVFELSRYYSTRFERENNKAYRIHEINDFVDIKDKTLPKSVPPFSKLVSIDNNGNKKYETVKHINTHNRQKAYKEFVIVDLYGKPLVCKKVLTAGKEERYDGYFIQKDKITEYYDSKNNKTGSIEEQKREYTYKDSLGKIIFSKKTNNDESVFILDKYGLIAYSIISEKSTDGKEYFIVIKYDDEGKECSRKVCKKTSSVKMSEHNIFKIKTPQEYIHKTFQISDTDF